ncbi:uncharacterized protein LOC122008652 isoform X1 [Zingiber officinale]|uniref:uncharacterized protein LOC122008652 isoform X1 n=2 Tax=Zingiber officinale TaxID=94328 RepID=UPI001C4D7F65|nr:uncharacterized protein LOC122008652 isoform X1 [Zingiber officinale]XP_042420387.1 uncharacterized protein LOC122008652 isoform X1 [Zingiber officinale]XP_042420388.1 uncharacterized protein LOC122008652 isoform X1 [Zingiber officinale]XP_042420389.1 uncharacterized protein LOC122008652 isoform X1 [Zingiber officinale]XP_042420390.1 uncharacterized protein LOC122008652 isoform X1 [Zingiber officinale]
MPLGLKSQVNGKRENFGETSMSISLLSKHEGKAFNREFDSKVNNGPDNKRPRLDQSDSYAKNIRVDDDSTICQKKTDLIRCSSADKVWLIKPKRGADGKRNDRKNFRSGIKTRYDTLPTKMGVFSIDSTSAGSNLLRTYGLKSDLSDITRHIDEVGISELLDGSYRYSNVNAEKGKKLPVVSESMLTSLKKAISVLPHDGLTYSNSNGKEAVCLSKFSSSPVHDCSHPNKDDESTNTKYPNIGDADLYQPKKILEHLAIPSGSDLTTLLEDLSLTSSTSKLTKPSKNFHAASLPPFSWSCSHSSACKPTADSSKLVLTKHECQGRWIRIDCNSLLTGDNQHFFLDLEMLTVDNNGDSLQRTTVLQDNHLDSSPKFPCGQLSNMVFQTSNSVERNAPDDIRLEKGPCLSVLTHKRLNFVEDHAHCSSNGLECDNKDNCLVRTSGTEASMKFQGKDPDLPDHIRSASMLCSTKVLKDLHTVNEPGCVSSGSFNCKDIGECSWSLPNLSASDMSQHDYSPQELHAAGILLEMTRHWSAFKVQTEDCGKIRRSKSSQKAMKNHKSISQTGRSEFFRTRNHDPVRTADLSYWEHKPIEKKNDMRMSGRVTIKNSNQLEGGVSPHKLEKDLHVGGASSLPNVTVRSTSLIPTIARVGNGYETHQKLRKTTGSSFMVGTCIKDWSRGRNKQE